MSNIMRKHKRMLEQKQKKEIQKDLVRRGKKLAYDKKGNLVEIKAQVPYRKEEN
jgi:hypothetical protein